MIHRPILKPYNKRQFEVAEDYTFENITIPKGYQTNGANIPRIFWSLFPPNSPEYLSAALIHDYMYDLAMGTYDNPLGITFKYADKKFYENLLELNVPKWKAWLFYKSVRLYSKIRW
jgi:hypothetical protein|nr:MAG TPA: Protein of unknown function (DUF1353) [Caudoviricetes sp.]